MLIKIFDLTYEFSNELVSIEPMFKKINEIINGSEYFFSHLIIDNVGIYEDYDSYIAEYIYQIQEIKVEVLTVQQFINNLLLSAEQYLTRALPEINKLTEEFYQDPTSETWEKLQLLLEGLQWINQMIISIDNSKHYLGNWFESIDYSAKIGEELKNLQEGMENIDTILIGDIILYDIYPLLEDFKNKVGKIIGQTDIREN